MENKRNCLWCGISVYGGGRNGLKKLYCTRQHSRFARTAKKNNTLHKRREYRICVICKVSLAIPHRANASTCSNNCRQKLNLRYKRHKGNPFMYLVFQPKMCVDCEIGYESLRPTSVRCKACRRVHMRNLHTHNRRCRKYRVPYEPFSVRSIFIRDEWTCQICKLPAPQELRGTYDPLAPELDHIIPLSMGPGISPGHVYSNCQCAHRKCNIDKNIELKVKVLEKSS